MFPSLAAEIHALEVPADAAAIVAAVALRDQLDARVADAIGEFARAGGHELDGSVTLGSWLSHRAGMDPRSATREARRDQRLARLPVLRAAFLDGRLSAGAVEVILARVPARHLARFGDHEAELIPLLVGLDVQQLAHAMADWRAKADALDPGPAPVELPDTVHLSPTIEDRCQLDGSLGPDLAAVVATAFRVYDCGDLSLPVAGAGARPDLPGRPGLQPRVQGPPPPAPRDGDDQGGRLGDLPRHRHAGVEVRPRRPHL